MCIKWTYGLLSTAKTSANLAFTRNALDSYKFALLIVLVDENKSDVIPLCNAQQGQINKNYQLRIKPNFEFMKGIK